MHAILCPRRNAEMKDIYLVNYAVKGIKTLDQLISLSFYKKTITCDPDTKDYNVKGIYGMNGSGKSGIVASVDIFRNLITNPGYLNNPIVQKNLDAIVNKKLGELFIEAEYLVKLKSSTILFKYSILLKRDSSGKYAIFSEELSSKPATSRTDKMETMLKVSEGEIRELSLGKNATDELSDKILKMTMNLLSGTSVSALFLERNYSNLKDEIKKQANKLFVGLISIEILGMRLHVYLDDSDDHSNYFINNSLRIMDADVNLNTKLDELTKLLIEMDSDNMNTLSVVSNLVKKTVYDEYEKTVGKLFEFLKIFKNDLKSIEIDKKEDRDFYVCSLLMIYDDYKIHTEFESTGIKKLIKLFTYLGEMVSGGIVFIDEFDSNLHDVYLCALLEYLMEYGEGQLCFTTHNVGPMDILRRNKKSIDFLSEDHKIYPWTKNGNYSPSKLYRSGMIEGSPFNVDSIDFIGVFNVDEEEDA